MDNTPLVPGKGLKILHLNAQSIRNKFSVLKKELETQGIDVLLFSESWLTELNIDEDYIFEKYNLYRVDRARPINAGGICAYVHESILCSPIIYANLNKSDINIEIQWLKVNKGLSKHSKGSRQLL